MPDLYAVLTTTAATATAAASTRSIIAGFAAAACAFDLKGIPAKVNAVHLMNRVVGIARIFKLQESKLHFDCDVANTAKLAKKLVQLALADVSGQIADVNPAHRNSSACCSRVIRFEMLNVQRRQ
jgi:hypothetical protein